MMLKYVFLNSLGRLRSGWRVTLFLASYFVLSVFYLLFILPFLKFLPLGFTQNNLAELTITFTFFSAVAIFFGWFYGKFFEDLPFRALGCGFTENWLKDLIFGLIIGAVSILLAALIAFSGGGLKFEFNQTANGSAILLTLGATLLIFIFGAISEETLFRGYILQTLFRARFVWLAIFLTSLLFASAHNNNPGANPLSWLNTLIAGIWFTIAYYKTRTLWLPFGLHLMWNWMQGAILGIPVSGLEQLTPAPLFHSADAGPVWLTGGNYGIEGGIACTIILILATIFIWLAPFLKPSEKMLILTDREKPVAKVKPAETNLAENFRNGK